MKYFVHILFLLLCGSSVFSQGLFNNGALIVIQTGALVKVDGDASGNYLNTTSGTDGRIDINGNMEVDGNWTNNATGGGHVFINIGTNGTVKLVGTTQQDVGGTVGTGWTDFENLTIINSAGARMTVDVNRVNGTLTLSSGACVLNSYTLIENNTSTSSVTRTSGYLYSETVNSGAASSRFQWNVGAGTGSYSVPFGTASVMIPFVFNIGTAGTVSSTGAVTASTYPTADNNTTWATYPSAVTNMNPDPLMVVDRFYTMNISGYSANPTADLTIYYDAGDLAGNTITEANLQAQAWDGSAWSAPVGTVNTGSDYVSSISSVSASRTWVLSDNSNPLPVELLSFTAVCDGEKINIDWATASETNNDYFSIERSSNAIEWDQILVVSGAGTTNNYSYYSAEDNDPLPGYAYYRLKQVDFDGAYTYSDVVQAGCESDLTFSIIAVVQGQQENEVVLAFTDSQNEHYSIMLYDASGRLVKNLQGESVSGYNEVHVNAGDLAEGIYMLTLQNNTKYLSQKILLK
jgi:hypothetical protein